MSDEGQLVADRYRITRRIGTGAMGAVWQGHDELLGRVVAIKQLLLQPGLEPAEAEEARQRTMREGRIAARLHHPNAITVFDAVTDEHGQPCLIMEYLESTSLATVIQDRGSVPPPEVARIGQQVASALKSAHQVGIVHRDIKPGNVLLTDDGVVKITDFGISKAKDDVSVTKTGLIAGTPAYLAPEVALGNEPGPESDVFSLGSTLYAATEGQPPFGLSENTLSLLHAVAAGQINPPVHSGPLTSVLALLLHPEKEQRPDAGRAEEVLAAVARGETPVGGPVTRESGVAGAGVVGAAVAGADEEPADEFSEDDAEPASTSGTLTGLATEGPDATRVAPMAAMGSHPGPEGSGADTDAEHNRPERRWKPLAAGGLAASLLAALAVWVFADPDQSHSESPTPPVTDDTTKPTTSTERTSTTARERTTTEPEPAPEPSPRPARTTDTGDPTDSTATSRDTTTRPTSSTGGGADGTDGGDETGGDDGTDGGDETGGDGDGGGDETGGDDGDGGGDETGGEEGDPNTATAGRT